MLFSVYQVDRLIENSNVLNGAEGVLNPDNLAEAKSIERPDEAPNL